MSYRIMLVVTRRADLTPEQFKLHYETEHVKLLKEIAGKDFPISHTRLYVSDFLVGSAAEFPYDALTEITFEDESHFKRFMALTSAEDAAKRIREDEARFAERSEGKFLVFSFDREETRREA